MKLIYEMFTKLLSWIALHARSDTANELHRGGCGLGEPAGCAVTVDLIAYKTLTVHTHRVSVGLELFNLTHHFNPRDVWAVAGVPQFGQFTTSLGTSVGGYLKVSLN